MKTAEALFYKAQAFLPKKRWQRVLLAVPLVLVLAVDIAVLSIQLTTALK